MSFLILGALILGGGVPGGGGSTVPSNIILREDGTPMLREDGSYFIRES